MLNLFENEDYSELISSLRDIAIKMNIDQEREFQVNRLLDNVNKSPK